MKLLLMFAVVVAVASSASAVPVEWPTIQGGNGHWYERVDQPGLNWEAARQAASAMVHDGVPGHLATLGSAEEDQWVFSHISNPAGYWIGGYQLPNSVEPAGGWQWVTGEPWVYCNWACNPNGDPAGCEPNNMYWDNSAEGYLEYDYGQRETGWNDMPNAPGQHGRPGFIVEFGTTYIQQTLFSEDFEEDLSRWSNVGQGQRVPDSQNLSNHALSFTGMAAGGDMISNAIPVNATSRYLFSFRYRGTASGNGSGGYLWLIDPQYGNVSTCPVWGTQPENANVHLIDDGEWHTYQLEFHVTDYFNLPSGELKIVVEDWNGAAGSNPPDRVAGDALFDDMSLVELASISFDAVSFPGLDDFGSGNSVAWLDFDNDGDLDLSVGAGADNTNRLFLNRLTENGTVSFDSMTNPLIATSNTTRGLGWGIFGPGDSCPDLYQGVPFAPNVLLNNSCGDVTDVTSAVTAGSSDQTNGVRVVDFDNDGRLDIHELRPAAPDRLLRNLGNWQFEEMPASALSIVDGSFDAAWADVDNDGDQDVYVTREAPWPNVLLRNDGNGAFVDVTPALLGLTDRSQGATWGDYDNDGDLDLFVTNWLAGDRLFRNDGGFSFTDTSVPGMAEARRGQSAVWGDLNNDGWLDLYVANQGDPNQMWLNVSGVAGRTFSDATPAIAAALGNSTGMGLADYDQDGDLDIYVGAHLGPNTLLRNELATGAHWLEVDLDATLSNASAVGARVRVVAGAQSMVREVGANNGMWSQEPGLQHFGLGGAAFADSIIIRWPSGVMQQLVNVPADARLTITEPLDLPPGDILFADNFDAGASASWIVPAGGWQAESQHYQNTNTSGFANSSFPLFYGSPSLANYSVQMDYVPTVAAPEGVALNLLINMSQTAIPWPYAGTTGYNISFGWHDSFGIAKFDGSGAGAGNYLVEVASDPRVHLTAGHTYVIVFAAEFGTLKFKVYEKGTADPGWMYTIDDATYGSGYFGLFTWNSLGWIDNVVVRAANEFNATVADVPNDQGGHLAVSWNRHLFDRAAAAIPVTEYAVQRFSGTWQNVAAVAATEADAYNVTVTTPNILTIGQPASYSTYRVLVKTANPAVYFASTPDSSYSIDNVAPPKPAVVLVDDLNFRYVTWANPGIADLATACVYRGTSAGFTPDTPVGCPGDFYNELDLDWYFYRVQFTDTHGNVSEFSDELHGQWPTPVPGAVPMVLRLYPCQPNPFNPRTTIKFDLPAAGAVRLAVFDLAGRLVRTLVGEQMAPGNHEVLWDGRDGSGREVGSGTYLARLDFGGKVQTIRMGLVR